MDTSGAFLGPEIATHVHDSYLWTYDLRGPVRKAFDKVNSITRASGRGLGPGNRDFLGTIWNKKLGNLKKATLPG